MLISVLPGYYECVDVEYFLFQLILITIYALRYRLFVHLAKIIKNLTFPFLQMF